MELSAILNLNAKNFEKGIKNAESGFKSFGSKLTSMAGKVTAIYTAVAGGVIGTLGKLSVSAYAQNEQLIGGVETLFKKSSGKLEQYANEAYRTAGVSANKYMEMSTSFAASLLNGLGGDTEKAAEMANMAIVDMSDNANKMGSDLTSIQNAYQGFAKQNYTMLDNLKLGYGGTKTEMQRLLKDAEKLTGKKFDLSNYADVVEAIHAIQTQMGITGTTSKEASTTIEGSVNSMKAAWQNLLTSMSGGHSGQTLAMTRRFTKSVQTMLKNVLPAARNFLRSMGSVFAELAPTIGEELPKLIADVLPGFIDAGWKLIQGLGKGIIEAAKKIKWPTWSDIKQGFSDAWNKIKQAIQDLDIALPNVDLSFITKAFKWIEDHKDVVIAAITGIIAAFAASKIAAFVSQLNPMTLLFEGIAAAILLVATNWDSISGWIGQTWTTTVEWVQTSWDGVKSAFDLAGQWVSKTWKTTVSWVQEKWQAVSDAFALAGSWIDNKANEIAIAWKSTTDAWLEQIKTWATSKTVGEIAADFKATVSEWFETIKNWLGQSSIGSAILDFGATVSEWFTTVKDWIASTSIGSATFEFLSSVSDWFTRIWDWMEGKNLSEIKTEITAKADEWLTTIKDWVNNKTVGEIAAEIKANVSEWFETIKSWLGQTTIGTAVLNFADKVSEWFTTIKDWISKTEIGSATFKFLDSVSEWFITIKDWISKTEIGSATFKFLDSVSEWFTRIWDWMQGKNLQEIKAEIGAVVDGWLDTVKGWIEGTGATKFTLEIGAKISEWIQRIWDWVTNGVNIAVNFFGKMFGGPGGSGEPEFGDQGDHLWEGFSGEMYGDAKGNWNVPYDNFPALLHRNEMVLTASQARKLRNGELGGGFEPGILAEAVRSAIIGMPMMLNDEVVGRVMGNAVTGTVNNNIGSINARRRYGYGG